MRNLCLGLVLVVAIVAPLALPPAMADGDACVEVDVSNPNDPGVTINGSECPPGNTTPGP